MDATDQAVETALDGVGERLRTATHASASSPVASRAGVIPLTKQPDGMQAWKIVIPTSKVDPEPRAHDGHEWIYVLPGHMRLVRGDRDWVLGPGEVAESTPLCRTGSAAPATSRRRS